MRKITPFLWFNDNAEEAVNFYTSIFPNARILAVTRYGEAGPGPARSVMTARFSLDGQEFIALNGGPEYTFTPAISFVVHCDTQVELDEMWERLADGGKEVQCGWIEDRFGVSWQIVPRILEELLSDPDETRAQRVTRAMLQMVKIDIEALRRAHDA